MPDANVTALLDRIRAGDDAASEALLDLVYGELRGLAGAIFNSPNPAHTLQPTALVHEAWMKMGGQLDAVEDRHHFFALAAILDWGTDGSGNGGDLTGPTPGSPPDGVVDVNDLNAVIVGWGACAPS